MVGHHSIYMFVCRLLGHIRLRTQCDRSDILIKCVMARIAIVVRLICTNGKRVPFAGEDTSASDLIKATANPAHPRKEIYEVEIRSRVTEWLRQKFLKVNKLSVAEFRTALATNPAINSFTTP